MLHAQPVATLQELGTHISASLHQRRPLQSTATKDGIGPDDFVASPHGRTGVFQAWRSEDKHTKALPQGSVKLYSFAFVAASWRDPGVAVGAEPRQP